MQDLKTIVLDSLATSCSMVFQPSWSISGLLGVSKLLLVIILAIHEDKVQVRSMGWAKFLCVSSSFDYFLTKGDC